MRPNLLRGLWLWLCGVFLLNLPLWDRSQRWEGATLGWSPIATTAAAGESEVWDMAGWYREGQRTVHSELRAVEQRLRSNLDDLLAQVYVWRDTELLA